MSKRIIRLTESNLRGIINETIHEIMSNRIDEVFKTVKNGVQEFGPGASSKKRRYANAIWQLIQRNYAYIGGCKTFDDNNGDGGFNDFLYGKYIWKVYFGENGDDIRAIIIYKPTIFGRKRVCSAGENIDSYKSTMDSDFYKSNHVYGEVSGKSENFMNKDPRTNWVDKNDVAQVLNKDISLEQDAEVDSHERLPYDADKHYYRNIGGSKHRKAMFGNPAIQRTKR